MNFINELIESSRVLVNNLRRVTEEASKLLDSIFENRINLAYLILKETAVGKTTIGAIDLANILQVDPGSALFANILDGVVDMCKRNNIPPLTPLVVNNKGGLSPAARKKVQELYGDIDIKEIHDIIYQGINT